MPPFAPKTRGTYQQLPYLLCGNALEPRKTALERFLALGSVSRGWIVRCWNFGAPDVDRRNPHPRKTLGIWSARAERQDHRYWKRARGRYRKDPLGAVVAAGAGSTPCGREMGLPQPWIRPNFPKMALGFCGFIVQRFGRRSFVGGAPIPKYHGGRLRRPARRAAPTGSTRLHGSSAGRRAPAPTGSAASPRCGLSVGPALG
jgi:hypothetical protein